MKNLWAWLISQYKTNLKFRAFVQAIEAAMVTALITATQTGIDLSTHGLKVLAAAVFAAIVTAIRNFLINPPGSPAGPTVSQAPPPNSK